MLHLIAHSTRLLLVLAIFDKVTYGTLFHGAIFNPTENCLITTLQTKEEPNTKRCAHLCLTDNNCVGFGYTTGTKSCRLASSIMHPDTDSQGCTAGEILYESASAPGPFICDTDNGWVYDSNALSCTGCDVASGWEYSSARDTCIKMFATPIEEPAAQTVCESVGANLAIFDSQAAMNVVSNLIQTKASVWVTGNDDGFWTGAKKTNNVWQWSSGATWILWHTNQPSGNGVCTQFWRAHITIDDLGCTGYNRDFVCERDLTVNLA